MTSRFGLGVTAELSGGNPCMTRLTLRAGHVQCHTASRHTACTKMEEEKETEKTREAREEADFNGRQRFCGVSALGLIPL